MDNARYTMHEGMDSTVAVAVVAWTAFLMIIVVQLLPVALTADKMLLRGLLFTDQGRAFTPGYTVRGPKYYRYYINTDAIKLGSEACEVQRMPAGEIESVVIEKLRRVLSSPEVLAHAVREVCAQRPDIGEAGAIQTLQSIDPVWDELFPAERARIVQTLVERITVRRHGISINWKTDGLTKLLRDTLASEPMPEAA